MKDLDSINVVYVDINELKPADYNPRKFSKKQFNELKESISKFGLVDPFIVNYAENRRNVIIGGHFRWQVAKELGIKKVPVVYVNIPDIEKEKELNLRLNKNLGSWDWDKFKNLFKENLISEELLKGIGFDIYEIAKIEDKPVFYTKKYTTPVYQPVGKKVIIKDLYDDSKANELIEEIEKSKIEPELKKFLKIASYRHVYFNYGNIAEFYAQLKDEKIKELFKKNALVIIDIDDAIEKGWVKMVKEIINEVENEYE
jgi:ParB/RepB/Spo0J family partition protein